MSERLAEPSMRTRLLDAGLRILTEEGPEALSTRRIAEAAQTSKMAVYTQFGSMPDLVRAVVDEGFAKLAEEFARVERTDDPIADLGGLLLAYRANAHANPHLYAVMFGTASLGGYRRSGRELAQGRYTFDEHVEFTRRAIDAGRFRPGDPQVIATQLWSAVHGYLTLELAGYFGRSGGLEQYLLPMLLTMVVGLGDDPEAASKSAAAWFGSGTP